MDIFSGIAYNSRGVFIIDLGELSSPRDSKSTMLNRPRFLSSKVFFTRAF